MVQMVITDLDGTLLDPCKSVSFPDRETLNNLGKKDICRVAATGRSMFSVSKVISYDFPLDYIIFSSGAGIINWKTKKILNIKNIGGSTVKMIKNKLIEFNISFMLHKALPDNHIFSYYVGDLVTDDFYKRIEFYKGFSSTIDLNESECKDAAQFLIILPNDIEHFERIRRIIQYFKIKIIRATSPFNGISMWMELFSDGVSKGSAANWLCEKLSINKYMTLGIGNDYNDIDLLDFTNYSYIMNNAPEDLKSKYKVTLDNSNSGFTEAVRKVLN